MTIPTTADTDTDWRNYDDRDDHQDRLATELSGDTGTW